MKPKVLIAGICASFDIDFISAMEYELSKHSVVVDDSYEMRNKQNILHHDFLYKENPKPRPEQEHGYYRKFEKRKR